MLYFGIILDFSKRHQKDTLKTVLGSSDYQRFKAEFATKTKVSRDAGNTYKGLLIKMKGTENKKQALNDEKKKA